MRGQRCVVARTRQRHIAHTSALPQCWIDGRHSYSLGRIYTEECVFRKHKVCILGEQR